MHGQMFFFFFFFLALTVNGERVGLNDAIPPLFSTNVVLSITRRKDLIYNQCTSSIAFSKTSVSFMLFTPVLV
jgi:hypothetical protein